MDRFDLMVSTLMQEAPPPLPRSHAILSHVTPDPFAPDLYAKAWESVHGSAVRWRRQQVNKTSQALADNWSQHQTSHQLSPE